MDAVQLPLLATEEVERGCCDGRKMTKMQIGTAGLHFPDLRNIRNKESGGERECQMYSLRAILGNFDIKTVGFCIFNINFTKSNCFFT